MSHWDFHAVADAVARALAQAEAELRLEQAVYGFDSRDEVAIQDLIATGISAEYHVSREVHYPSSFGRKLSHRARCDLVLSPPDRPLRVDQGEMGLFASLPHSTPAEALWLEVKVAWQFREGGVRHSGYGAQWRTAVVQDLQKMEQEPLIRHAGLLLVVFTESAEIVEKDLELFESVLVQKEVLAGFRQVRTIPILERMGHSVCTVSIWPTIQR